MNTIRELLKASKYPLILHMKDKEVASDTTISTFKGEDGVVFATNVEEPKALTDGTTATKIKDVEQEGISDEDRAEMATVVDTEGNKYLLHSELAFDLIDGEPVSFKSPITGADVTLAYDDMEGAEDDSSNEDESEEDESSEEDMGGEDESNEDESDESGEEEESNEDESEEDESGDESMEDDDSGEEEIDSVMDMEDEGDSEDDEEEDPAEMAVEVSMLNLVDTNKAPKLVAFNNNGTEFAVFVGDNHIGMLRHNQAAETAAVLFEDSNKLYHTFKDRYLHCAKKGSFGELASLGFTPIEVSTTIKDVALRYIQEELTTKTEAAAVEQANYRERSTKLLSLSMVGLAKGVFGKNNALVAEVASALARAQVVNPTGTARVIVAKAAAEYASEVIEQVSELEGKSDAYLNGITDAVSKADFKSTGEETASVPVSTMFGSPTRESETAGVVAPSRPAATSQNRFAHLVSGLGTRRNR